MGYISFLQKKIWFLCAIRFLYFFFNLVETGYVVDVFLDNFINVRDTRYSATNINLLYHSTTFCSVEPICLEFEWSSFCTFCICPELLNVKPFHEFWWKKECKSKEKLLKLFKDFFSSKEILMNFENWFFFLWFRQQMHEVIMGKNAIKRNMKIGLVNAIKSTFVELMYLIFS